MDDKQFISQMAQFSSLEQMTNINKELKSLIRSSRSSEAYGLLGKRIDAFVELVAMQEVLGYSGNVLG